MDFEKVKQEYNKLYMSCQIRQECSADAAKEAKKIISNKSVYQQVESFTKVPWFVIGILHCREAGLVDVGRWLCCLHNGERIIGTGRKTSLVPKGRGPFKTWVEAAVDALTENGLASVDWSNSEDGVARTAWALENFNGWGYRTYHNMPSPYLWGGTTVQVRGKYTSDGKFDAQTMDPQVGGMALLREIQSLDHSAVFGMPLDGPEKPTSSVPSPVPNRPSSGQPKPASDLPSPWWVTLILHIIGRK